MKKHAFRCCTALLLSMSGAAFAAGAADGLTAADPVVRLMPPGARATAAFMTLKNDGDKEVKVVKVDTAVAKTAELHTHINENGVMKMRQVPAIAVKAKGETRLKPGGYHVMLINPTGLKEGEKVTITLGLDDGSAKQIEATVKKPEVAPKMEHMHHDHKH